MIEASDLEIDNYDLEDFFDQIQTYFVINDTCNLLKSKLIKYKKIEDIQKEIFSYKINTGIFIDNFCIDENYSIYIFVFDAQIVLIDETNLQQFQQFFDKFRFNEILLYSNQKCKEKMNEAKTNKFIKKLKFNNSVEKAKFLKKLKNQIAYMIIKKSQIRTNNRRHNYDDSNDHEIRNFDYKEFINLKSFPVTNLVYLSFNVKDQFLYILKYFYVSDRRSNRLINFFNYNNNKNPFICRLYGTFQYERYKIFAFEYVEGLTLENYIQKKKGKIQRNEKVHIIFDILSAIEYLHLNNYIYRDLKNDNIIIDSKNRAILIDFDQIREKDDDDVYTSDIGIVPYVPSEQLESKYSFESDIYSIGIIISSIFFEENPIFFDKILKCPVNYEQYYEFYKCCFEKNPSDRPNISELFNYFFCCIESKKYNQSFIREMFNIREKLFQQVFNQEKINDMVRELLTLLSNLYLFGHIISRDINKAIHYLEILSNLNESFAQFYLGIIYYDDRYIPQNIAKAIHYFELSAKQGYVDAYYYLGEIYYIGYGYPRNINKAAFYLKFASNNGNKDANFFLGKLYYENESHDVNKAIYYFKHPSERLTAESNYYLGLIYKNEPKLKDMEKAIYYFTLSANQFCSISQFTLAEIYLSIDINKSIYYFNLCSYKNDETSQYAQYFLGLIYYESLQNISRDINKSVYFLTLSANQNNQDAQYLLGFIYYEGKYVEPNINKSLKYLTFSANQNNSKAQFLLGLIFLEGEYISRDVTKSIYYLTFAANQNNILARLLLGIIYFEGRFITSNIKKSLFYLNLCANQNNACAQSLLGAFYYEGKYVQKDFDKAFYLLNLSSKQNDKNAQFYLGKIFYEGKNVKKDIKKSMHYLTLSANQNNSCALFCLGIIYYENKDINKSVYYLNLSANQNDPNAQFLLGLIYYENKYIQRNIEKSIHYLTLSAYKENSDAQFLLGIIYYDGKYVHQNINKSIQFLTLAANNSNSESCFLLGKIYYDGKYIQKNIKMAIKYFKDAANLNNLHAKNYLGIIYKNGDDVEKNICYSKIYFSEAIEKNNDPYSMYNLARIYYFGIDSEQNYEKSIDLLRKSSEYKFLPSSLFLFYINYSNNFEFNFKFDQINKLISDILKLNRLNVNNIFLERFHTFLKEYDLCYQNDIDYLNDFSDYIKTGSFKVQQSQKKIGENINPDFYEGFYND